MYPNDRGTSTADWAVLPTRSAGPPSATLGDESGRPTANQPESGADDDRQLAFLVLDDQPGHQHSSDQQGQSDSPLPKQPRLRKRLIGVAVRADLTSIRNSHPAVQTPHSPSVAWEARGFSAPLRRRTTQLSSRGRRATMTHEKPTCGPGLLQRLVRPLAAPAGTRCCGRSARTPPAPARHARRHRCR